MCLSQVRLTHDFSLSEACILPFSGTNTTSGAIVTYMCFQVASLRFFEAQKMFCPNRFSHRRTLPPQSYFQQSASICQSFLISLVTGSPEMPVRHRDFEWRKAQHGENGQFDHINHICSNNERTVQPSCPRSVRQLPLSTSPSFASTSTTLFSSPTPLTCSIRSALYRYSLLSLLSNENVR